MEHKSNLIPLLLLLLAVYFGIKHLVPGGGLALYPINLFVTFLHEFGHAVGALVTGGGVQGIQVNPDGSGYCITLGGNRAITLMGGYIGSAIFGNALLYVGAKMPRLAEPSIYALALSMIFTAVFWFNSVQTSGLLIGFGLVFILLAYFSSFARFFLMFIGLASIIHIVEDFNVGPTSDLKKYAEIFHVIPMQVWMYIWLLIVLLLCVANLRLIFRR